jgi:hypothetical protein
VCCWNYLLLGTNATTLLLLLLVTLLSLHKQLERVTAETTAQCVQHQMSWIGQVSHDIGTSLQVISLATEEVTALLNKTGSIPQGHPSYDLLLTVLSSVELLQVINWCFFMQM